MEEITSDDMAKIDFLAINKYNISLLQMMELAGYNLAELVSRVYLNSVDSTKIIVLSGKGNNGGGGLSAARHLKNRGYNVDVILAEEEGLSEASLHHIKTLNQMKIPISVFNNKRLPQAAIIIDALIGYGLRGNPKEPIAEMIRKTNDSIAIIISLDVPTGLNTSTGKIMAPCTRAAYTMILAYPKIGLYENPEFVGELLIAEIGIPQEIYKEMGLERPEFFMEEG